MLLRKPRSTTPMRCVYLLENDFICERCWTPQCVSASIGHSSKSKSILNGNCYCDAAQLGSSVTNNSATTAYGWQFCCTDFPSETFLCKLTHRLKAQGLNEAESERNKILLAKTMRPTTAASELEVCVCVSACRVPRTPTYFHAQPANLFVCFSF